MRALLARIFRIIFKIPFFRKYFFWFHKRIFYPLNLFKNVTRKVKINNNIIFSLNINDWVQENLYFLGEYEKAELKTLDIFLKEDSTFIDLGANIGLYTLYASRLVGKKGHVISFEPFKENYKTLIKNISLNECSNILAENLAISKKNEIINLYWNVEDRNLGMVSTTYNIKNSKSEIANAVSLDYYFKKNNIGRIDFIKIDIEGFEYQALLGMKEILSNYNPILLIEILPEKGSSELSNAFRIANFLKEFNYIKYYIDDSGKSLKKENGLNRYNFLFIKTLGNTS